MTAAILILVATAVALNVRCVVLSRRVDELTDLVAALSRMVTDNGERTPLDELLTEDE